MAGELTTLALSLVFSNLFYSFIQDEGGHKTDHLASHYCSLRAPCNLLKRVLHSFYSVAGVSHAWKLALEAYISEWKGENGCGFFARIESVYYPNPRHINALVRTDTLLRRLRVVKTVHTDEDDRGVFEVLDYGSPAGCAGATEMIVKAWMSADDEERVVECRVYDHLACNNVEGVPLIIASQFDENCGVYVLEMEKLGPSLDNLLELIPEKRLNEKMLLALAIQLMDRYESLHKALTIHNGVKPGNICLSRSAKKPTKICIIDFGFSTIHPTETERSDVCPTPSEAWNGVVGNRQFLSVFGHLGITQSQRDDLESLGYLFSFLFHGKLPWLPVTTTQKGKLIRSPSIWPIKMGTPPSTLFADMDKSFLEFWKEVKSLAFGERPNYAKLKAHFMASWEQHGWDEPPGEIDWIKIYQDLESQEYQRFQLRQELFRKARS